jgi:hypothetical protein
MAVSSSATSGWSMSGLAGAGLHSHASSPALRTSSTLPSKPASDPCDTIQQGFSVGIQWGSYNSVGRELTASAATCVMRSINGSNARL